MGKATYENNIKGISVNIAKTLTKQGLKINENLEKKLSTRLERNNFEESKYIGSLKSNVIFYKVSIRNRELLLLKWIENKSIPEKKLRDEELDKLVKKCRDYVQNGMKSGGKTLNERDLKSLLLYEKMEKAELRKNLELEFKTLNLYNDVLSIFINDISTYPVEELNDSDLKEIMKIIRTELRKATNFIIKSFDNLEEVNTIGIKTLDVLRNIDEEELTNKIERFYQESCTLEEIKYYKGYGFGKEGIKEYILAVVLLDLVNEEEQILIKGVVRLLIGGEFGINNFRDFIEHIVTKRININSLIYKEALNIIEENFQTCINNELSERRFKEDKHIDIDEYIYILENTDSSKRYRRDNNEFDGEENPNISTNDSSVENPISIDNEEELQKGKGKKIALICSAVVVGIGLGIGGLYIGGVFENNKPKDEAYNSQVKDATNIEKDYEEDTYEDEEYNSEEYFISDSNSRYLTVSELESYSDIDLGYIRNEIFARYGYIFENEKYSDYFNSKSWYTPDSSFSGDEEELNDYEIANIKLIKSLESTRQANESGSSVDYSYVDYDNADEYYSIYTEAYNDKGNAEEYVKTLAEKNIISTIVVEDDIYKVRVGSAYTLDIAKEIEKEINDKSVRTYILGYSSYYDEQVEYLRELAYEGNYEELESEYLQLKNELENNKEFGRYLNLINELYEEYM